MMREFNNKAAEGVSMSSEPASTVYNPNNANPNDPSAIGTAANFGINIQTKVDVQAETPTTSGKQANTQQLLDQNSGQKTDIEHQKGAILGQVQDVKQKVGGAAMNIAQDRGVSKANAGATFGAGRQTTMVDAVGQLAMASMGGVAVNVVSAVLDLRSSMKGMGMEEARSVIRDAIAKVDSANHQNNFVRKVSATKSFDADNDGELSDTEIDRIIEFLNTPEEQLVEAYDQALDEIERTDQNVLAVEEHYNETIAAAIENNDAGTLASIGATDSLDVTDPLCAFSAAAAGTDVSYMRGLSLAEDVEVNIAGISGVQEALNNAAPVFTTAAADNGASSHAIPLKDPFKVGGGDTY